MEYISIIRNWNLLRLKVFNYSNYFSNALTFISFICWTQTIMAMLFSPNKYIQYNFLSDTKVTWFFYIYNLFISLYLDTEIHHLCRFRSCNTILCRSFINITKCCFLSKEAAKEIMNLKQEDISWHYKYFRHIAIDWGKNRQFVSGNTTFIWPEFWWVSSINSWLIII